MYGYGWRVVSCCTGRPWTLDRGVSYGAHEQERVELRELCRDLIVEGPETIAIDSYRTSAYPGSTGDTSFPPLSPEIFAYLNQGFGTWMVLLVIKHPCIMNSTTIG